MVERRIGLPAFAAAVLMMTKAAALADEVPPQLLGDWAANAMTCQTGPKLRADRERLILMNGTDMAIYGGVNVAHSFFGPDYRGIQMVVMPAVDETPFTVTFNFEEKRGVTSVEIYREIKGNTNPQVAAIQARSRALAKRFALDHQILTKCAK